MDSPVQAVRAQVRAVVRQVSHAEPVLAEAVRAGRVEVRGARYDLDTGRVEVIE